jgi:alpha-D-ribose 1-methylphosphonate 5-triphosphate diphosphatase PhnM
VLLYGVYHNAVVTSEQLIHLIYPQPFVNWLLLVGISQHLAKFAISEATNVPVHVVYQHPFVNWQLSVGISQHCAKLLVSGISHI